MKSIPNIPADWLEQLAESWTAGQQKIWWQKIEAILKSNDLTPPIAKLFYALESCSFEKTRVIILGQDPYPTFGHANGMAFSVEDFVQPLPKSLMNIFKELKRSVPSYEMPLKGDLSPWAQQGVLLLNTCLTTKIGIANAHQNQGWEEFTDILLQTLFRKKTGLVALFWGNPAKAKIPFLETDKHYVLTTSHPSPLSNYRGFSGCNHFRLCNEYLLKKGENEIDWQT